LIKRDFPGYPGLKTNLNIAVQCPCGDMMK
jgi:hypothetical protein